MSSEQTALDYGNAREITRDEFRLQKSSLDSAAGSTSSSLAIQT